MSATITTHQRLSNIKKCNCVTYILPKYSNISAITGFSKLQGKHKLQNFKHFHTKS